MNRHVFVMTTDRSKVVVPVLVVLCMVLWLLAVGIISCFVLFISYCCVQWSMSSIEVTLLEKRELVVLFFFGL